MLLIIPDIMNLFLSGFIFMTLFGWLNNKVFDVSIMTIWSLIVSYIIKIFCTVIHGFILTDVIMDEYFKILVYIILGAISAFGITKLLETKILHKLLYKTNNKSINDDIFDDIIDYKKPTMMQVYIKSSDVYYIGRFAIREEKGLDSWLVLVDYCSANRNTNNMVYSPSKDNLKSTVAINLSDIECIELIYEDDSETWSKLSGETKTATRNVWKNP